MHTCSLLTLSPAHLTIQSFDSLFHVVGAFRFCDLDADGRVQVADLRAALNCALSLIGGMFSVSSESAHARVDAIFASMDADADGWAEEGDFSRVALEDPEILQGLLLYDGAI